jgi:flagellar basal-body rod protein FlgF
MENAQLISLSRQISLQRQMDVTANNIANMNTTGFKAQALLFQEYLAPVARDRDFAYPDQRLSFVDSWGTVGDFTGGDLADTGNPLDVALIGEGFLAVQTPAGERWSRGGSLAIDRSGVLVDLNGNPVLSDGGPISFDTSETDISIASDGTISSSAGTKGRLRVVEFANPQELTREGNSLFAGGTPVAATETSVVQGSVEKSNVSGVAEMSEMIRVQRAYESLASLASRQDDIRRDAIKRLGSLNA